MGQAKRRGTFEERRQQAADREAEAYAKAREERQRAAAVQTENLKKGISGHRRSGVGIGARGMMLAAAAIAGGGMIGGSLDSITERALNRSGGWTPRGGRFP